MTQCHLIHILTKEHGFKYVGSTNTRRIYCRGRITIKIVSRGNYGVEFILDDKSTFYSYDSKFSVHKHIIWLVQQYE